MKKIVCLSGLLAFSGLVSCIQDEPLCPEAEIVSFSIPEEIAFSEPTINQGTNTIEVFVKGDADITQVAPTIEVNERSTLYPESGSEQDFTSPVLYTVTAEDGKHRRDYTVRLVPMRNLMSKFTFDSWETNSIYHYEYPMVEMPNGSTFNIFASSNQGIVLYQQFASPELYPTHSVPMNGGKAVEMVTKEGPGSIFGILNIPVIAGSLFTGTMDLMDAMKNPLSATKFGQPIYQKPLRLKGKYKYKAGQGDYIDSKGNTVPGRKDECAVYAVFYQTDSNLQTLDGTNILTHPKIISIAMLPDKSSTPGDGLVEFDIPFTPTREADLDFEKNTYKLALVLSSSFYGDHYEGTIGSRLIVDDIEIVTE